MPSLIKSWSSLKSFWFSNGKIIVFTPDLFAAITLNLAFEPGWCYFGTKSYMLNKHFLIAVFRCLLRPGMGQIFVYSFSYFSSDWNRGPIYSKINSSLTNYQNCFAPIFIYLYFKAWLDLLFVRDSFTFYLGCIGFNFHYIFEATAYYNFVIACPSYFHCSGPRTQLLFDSNFYLIIFFLLE